MSSKTQTELPPYCHQSSDQVIRCAALKRNAHTPAISWSRTRQTRRSELPKTLQAKPKIPLPYRCYNLKKPRLLRSPEKYKPYTEVGIVDVKLIIITITGTVLLHTQNGTGLSSITMIQNALLNKIFLLSVFITSSSFEMCQCTFASHELNSDYMHELLHTQ